MIERKNGEFFAAIADLQERKLAFLDYIAGFYNSGNRSEVNGHCVYSASANSPGCAIGQFLSPELAAAFDCMKSWHGGSKNITSISNGFTEYMEVPDWLRAMGQRFLQSIQSFHDRRDNWDENGLTEEGQIDYNTIANTIKSNEL